MCVLSRIPEGRLYNLPVDVSFDHLHSFLYWHLSKNGFDVETYHCIGITWFFGYAPQEIVWN